VIAADLAAVAAMLSTLLVQIGSGHTVVSVAALHLKRGLSQMQRRHDHN
jgi:hypothetical protein